MHLKPAIVRRLGKPKGLLLAGVVVSIAGTLIGTRGGPGLSYDSINYLSAGLNLESGHGLQNYSHQTMTVFAPAFSVVIATGVRLGLGAEWTVRLVNAGAFAVALVLGFMLLREHVRDRSLKICCTVLVVATLPLLQMAEMALTEPVFIVICLAFILVLERSLSSDRQRYYVVAAALLAWAAFMFRYAGLALLPAGTLVILVGLRRNGFRRAASLASAFIALAAVGSLIWMARNYAVDGTVLGARTSGGDNPLATTGRALGVFGGWLLPSPAPLMIQYGLGSLLVMLLVASLARSVKWGITTIETVDARVVSSLTLIPCELRRVLCPLHDRGAIQHRHRPIERETAIARIRADDGAVVDRC